MSSVSGPDLDPETALRRRARAGIVFLALRTTALQLMIMGGEVYLRRLLTPADFGAFAIAQFALVFFSQFGDAGLGGALIQKKDEPTQVELSSIWWLQVMVALAVVAVMWTTAPLALRIWPDISGNAVWLIRALSLDLFLTAVRVVPTMLMERHLSYGRLATLEVLLTVPYYVAGITLARMNFGLVALVAAVLAHGVFGAIGAFIMRPWAPSLVMDRAALRPIVRFGATYQLKHIVGLVCGAIAPVYAGRVLGQAQLGFIDWAQRTAFFPLKLVEVMSRVSFPLYSRLQDDRRSFAHALERSVQLCAMGTLFFVGLVFALGPNIVLVLYTEKWLPALPLLYVYAAGICFGFLSPLVFPAFDATGRPGINLRFTIGWTIGIALLAPLLTQKWGSLGFAVGYCVPMALGNIGIIVVLKRLIPSTNLWPRTRASLLGGAAVVLVGHNVLAPRAGTPLFFTFSVFALAGVFLGVVLLFDRTAIDEIRSLLPRNKP